MSTTCLLTSESVTEGHPDKVADAISDSILDEIIKRDKDCRVACETLVTTGLAFIAGEITTNCYVDIPKVVRETIRDIGYDSSNIGFDWKTCSVITSIDLQSEDIAIGVNSNKKNSKEQGAGDQGLMFGFATNETPEYMPMTAVFAHKLAKQLTFVRKNNIIDFLRPDGKTQVTIEYQNGKPKKVKNIVVSSQHKPNINHTTLKEAIIEEVIKKVIPKNMIDQKIKYLINPTGRFVIGGPMGDCGITGRKIIVDTYGGYGSHGGGCFSGKDPSKVDRTASYMARYVAKNIVAAGLSDKCEIQIAYAIGIPKPVSIMIDLKGSGNISQNKIEKIVSNIYDFRPAKIIEKLNLLRPIYKKTSSYGHFGRKNPNFTWEKIDNVDLLKTEASSINK